MPGPKLMKVYSRVKQPDVRNPGAGPGAWGSRGGSANGWQRGSGSRSMVGGVDDDGGLADDAGDDHVLGTKRGGPELLEGVSIPKRSRRDGGDRETHRCPCVV